MRISDDLMKLLKIIGWAILITTFVVRQDANSRTTADAVVSIKEVLQSHDRRIASLEETKIRRESYELGVEDGVRDTKAMSRLKAAGDAR